MAIPPLFEVLDKALDAMQQDAHAPRPPQHFVDTETPPVTSEPTPEERRDQGIENATQHANRVRREWSAQADAYAKMMIARRGFKPFLLEEIVEASKRDGVPQPPDGRAWGGVIIRLAKEGLVRKMGYGAAKTSNTSPKVLWGKTVAEKEERHVHD